jgi:cytochrome c biogenesis protein CcmG/thiol:disulfide interchange protein DsbE
MKRWLLWLPLIVFVVLIAVAGSRLLTPPDTVVKSALIGKPLPDFTLDPMIAGKPGLQRADFGTGKPRLLNVFASWCVPCIAEAPQLMKLKAAATRPRPLQHFSRAMAIPMRGSAAIRRARCRSASARPAYPRRS